MASTGLKGPFPLTRDGIANAVTRSGPGAYALGQNDGRTFYVSRVGRSDIDVGGRLSQYLGEYSWFKYDYFPSPKSAFEKECRLFHDFNPPANVVHPDRPSGTNWRCPCCQRFD